VIESSRGKIKARYMRSLHEISEDRRTDTQADRHTDIQTDTWMIAIPALTLYNHAKR